MKKIKIGFRDIIGLLFSLFFLWLTVKDFSFENIVFDFNARTAIYIALACLFVTAPTFVNAFRFHVFFKKNENKNEIKTIPSFFIGNFYNAILPGNLGEVVKLYHFGKKYEIRKNDLLAFWAVEKFLGAMLLPFLFVFPLIVIKNNYVKTSLTILIAIILFALIFMLLAQKSKRIRKFPFALVPFLKAKYFLYSVFCNFLFIIKTFVKDKRIYIFYIYSIAYFGGVLLLIYCTIHAAGLPEVFGSLDALMLLCTIALVSSFIPSLPSSAGVMHYGMYAAFVILANHYHIQMTATLNNSFVIAAALFHFIIFFTEVLLGIPFIWKERKWLFGKKNDIIQSKNELVFK